MHYNKVESFPNFGFIIEEEHRNKGRDEKII
jgi:hypothetical protein